MSRFRTLHSGFCRTSFQWEINWTLFWVLLQRLCVHWNGIWCRFGIGEDLSFNFLFLVHFKEVFRAQSQTVSEDSGRIVTFQDTTFRAQFFSNLAFFWLVYSTMFPRIPTVWFYGWDEAFCVVGICVFQVFFPGKTRSSRVSCFSSFGALWKLIVLRQRRNKNRILKSEIYQGS